MSSDEDDGAEQGTGTGLRVIHAATTDDVTALVAAAAATGQTLMVAHPTGESADEAPNRKEGLEGLKYLGRGL